MNAEAEDRSRPPTHQATDAAEETLALHSPVPTVEGDTLGHYRLKRELGRGGQAVVYLAEDTRLKRQVALKVLRAGLEAPEILVRRFLREAETASRLEHPAICPVYEAGTVGAIPFIAMRHVEGQTLASLIGQARRSGEKRPAAALARELAALAPSPESTRSGAAQPNTVAAKRHAEASVIAADEPIDAILRLVEAVARALHAAHEAGIVHRDVKPGNIMVTPRGEPVILDFGLASDEANELNLTQTGDLLGTPAYMSPEQLMAQRIRLDRRTDVYSLAATLYECVALRRPFDAVTREAMYQAIQYKEPTRARHLNHEIPADLEIVLEKGLEKDRDRRYPTALAFAEDLRRVRAIEPVSARRVSAGGRLARWALRRPVRAALLAILLIGVPAVGALAGYAVAKAPEIRRGEALALRDRVERHLEKGYAEFAHGDLKVAAAAFESALGLQPDCGEAITAKALALCLDGDFVGCLRFLEGREEFEGSDYAITRCRWEALSSLGRSAEAEAFDKSGVSHEAKSALGLWVAGMVKMGDCRTTLDKNFFREAALLFKRAALTAPHARLKYHNALAHAAQHLEDVETSRLAHEALLELWPDSVVAAIAAGNSVAAFDPEVAIVAYRKAIELNPQYVEAQNGLGHALDKLGRPAEAIESFRKVAALRPTDVAAHFNLGVAYRKLERWDEAILEYQKAIELDPSDAESYDGLGIVFNVKHEYDAAREALEKAVALEPDHPTAYEHLADTLTNKGDVDEAIAVSRRLIAKKPDEFYAWFILGWALNAKGELDESLEIWKKQVERRPAHLMSHMNLGAAFKVKGDLDAAIAAFRKATELDPACLNAHCELARCCLRNGNLLEALESCRRVNLLGAASFADWLPDCEKAVLAEARRLASAGLEEDEPSDLNESAQLLEALLRGWREDLDQGQRTETIADALRPLVGQAPWVTLRDPNRAAKLPDAERRRWRNLFSTVDELVRRTERKN